MADCEAAAGGGSAWFNTTHTHNSLVSGQHSQVLDPSVSNDFLFLTHTHSSRCMSVVVLLMYYSQRVQIILANNFLFPVSDLLLPALFLKNPHKMDTLICFEPRISEPCCIAV